MKKIICLLTILLLSIYLTSCAKDIVYEPKDKQDVEQEDSQELMEQDDLSRQEDVLDDEQELSLEKIKEMEEDLKEKEKELIKKLEKLPNLQPETVKNTNIIRIREVAKRAFDPSVDVDEEQLVEKEEQANVKTEAETRTENKEDAKAVEKETTKKDINEEKNTVESHTEVQEDEEDSTGSEQEKSSITADSKNINDFETKKSDVEEENIEKLIDSHKKVNNEHKVDIDSSKESVEAEEAENEQEVEIEQTTSSNKKIDKEIDKADKSSNRKTAVVVTCDECLQNYDTIVEDAGDNVYVWKLRSVRNMSIVKEWIDYVSQKTKVKVGQNWLIGKFDDEDLKDAAVALSEVLHKHEQIACTIYLPDNRTVNFLSKRTVDVTYKDIQLYRVHIDCSNSCHITVVDAQYKSIYNEDVSYDAIHDIQDIFKIKIRRM